jgi:hypothetical protein
VEGGLSGRVVEGDGAAVEGTTAAPGLAAGPVAGDPGTVEDSVAMGGSPEPLEQAAASSPAATSTVMARRMEEEATGGLPLAQRT